jgi:hypothetical protein
LVGLVSAAPQGLSVTPEQRIESLEREVETLKQQLGTLEDVQAIRKLQFTYGYFMDKFLYREVVDLFSDRGELRFMGAIWRGKASLKRLYVDRLGNAYTKGVNGPIDGVFTEYPQIQDIVEVAPDRKTAKGRFRYFQMAGSHITKTDMNPHFPQQWWEAGTYENTYVNEDGIWKILILGHHLSFQADYQTGWRYSQPAIGYPRATYPEDPLGPDEIVPDGHAAWPQASFQPFHYVHPVTGKPIEPEKG